MSRSSPNPDPVLSSLLRRRQIMPLEHVTALTGISRVDMVLGLRDRLDGYPEQQWIDRCVHFEIFERAFKRSVTGM